jgi:hypothetical protein
VRLGNRIPLARMFMPMLRHLRSGAEALWSGRRFNLQLRKEQETPFPVGAGSSGRVTSARSALRLRCGCGCRASQRRS